MKYLFSNARLISLPTLNWVALSTSLVVELLTSLLSYVSLHLFVRLRKAPYADSYWFLYSAKMTYYTERTVKKY